jgi:3-dehydroquinate synthase
MAACLDLRSWAGYLARRPSLQKVIREARTLKRAVCATDPYERSDRRRVLNFGHTFGHLLESLTDFRLSHGEAVCLGILCALDVGRAMRVTRAAAADELEAAFTGLWHAVNPRTAPRRALARALSGKGPSEFAHLLSADKKVDARGRLRMVLVTIPGHCKVLTVEEAVWRELLRQRWRTGEA